VLSDFQPVPYRIRIGVTGHRKLADESLDALVRQAIDTRLETLFSEESRSSIARARQRGKTCIRYSAVSPLAEGADRVVARAVLSYEGARLDAVLPLTIEDYIEDFKTQASKDEFRLMLASCRRPTLLRSFPIACQAKTPAEAATLRRAAYEAVGQYVVDHCDVLIAIWDGLESRGRGGTKEVVDYAIAQQRPVVRIWDGHIEILERAHGLDASALEAVDRFNRIAIREGEREGYSRSLEHRLFELPAAATDLSEDAKAVARSYLFPYYVQASTEAKAHQAKYYRAGWIIYLASALAVASVAVAVLVRPIAPFCFALEFVLLSGIWYVHRRSREWHQVWMESRFLAERIRSGIFMAACGVDTVPIGVLPFMGPAHTIDDWMVRVFDEVWTRLPALPGCTDQRCLAMNRYVREAWLEDQIRFHRRKAAKEGRAWRRLELATQIILPTTVAAALLHLILGMIPEGSGAPEWAERILTFVALVFPAVAASLAGLDAQRQHLRLEQRSLSLVPQLENLNRLMASAAEPARFEELLHRVDEVMLRETQDWLMLMRYSSVKAG
jgi:uncharacterized membrane protein YozB (DUF420 family)